MKVRIKFAKYGAMKFIGHLDMMRYFQKAMRRAQIDIAFSEGFSPHMIMSFALPLGVGVTSEAEYMDIEIRTPISSKEAVMRLNEVMAEGVRVLSFCEIPQGKASNAMTLVGAARYLAKFCADPLPDSVIEQFLSQEQIIVTKTTKSGEREENIRPMIFDLHNAPDGCIDLTLAAGSAANLKPELAAKSLFCFAGCGQIPPALQIHRRELYTLSGDRLISLEELGRDIEL